MGKRLIIPGADFSAVAINAAAPVITIASNGAVTITANGATAIYYTTNGDAPTTSSTQYTVSFTVAIGTTVKAIASYDGEISHVASETYMALTPVSLMTWCADKFMYGKSWGGSADPDPNTNVNNRCCLISYNKGANNLDSYLAQGYTKVTITVKNGFDFVLGTGIWNTSVHWYKGNEEETEFGWVTDSQTATAPLAEGTGSFLKVNLRKDDNSTFDASVTLADIVDDIVLT